MNFKKYAVFVIMALVSNNVSAWDSEVIGKVDRIEVHSPSSSSRNITFNLQKGGALCSRSKNNTTAYIQKSQTPDTYDIMLSILLSAKITGAEVKIYMDIGSEGCQVHRIDLL